MQPLSGLSANNVCRECEFLSLKKISSAQCYSSRVGFYFSLSAKTGDLHALFNGSQSYPKSSVSLVAVKNREVIPSSSQGTDSCHPWDLCPAAHPRASQSLHLALLSYACMRELCTDGYTVFLPISQWFSVVTSGGVIISISKIVTATTHYGNFLHWNVNIFFPLFFLFDPRSNTKSSLEI